MPREYAKNWFSMWTDEDFCTGRLFDKLFYQVLIGQSGTNDAGICPINFRKWRKALRDGEVMPTELDLKASLVRQERRRYVFTDEDTGEVLIRAHIRRDQVYKQPAVLVSALRDLAACQSPKFAAVMLAELDRIELPEIKVTTKQGERLKASLDKIYPAAVTHLRTLSEGSTEPLPEPFLEDLPEGLPEPFPIPAKTEGSREGSTEGSIEPPVVVEVEVAISSSGDTHLSEKEPPYPPSAEIARLEPLPARTRGMTPQARMAELNKTARSLTAYRVAEAFSASLPVPIEHGLLAGVGTQIDKCLRSGISTQAIAAGLQAWTNSDSWSPTQIPNFVHKANNRGRNGHGKPTEKALGYDDALNELLQEVTTL